MSPRELIADATLDPDEPLRWSTSAMTASGFAVVCAEVASRDRPSVLECGSGFSTLKLAELTHERGGRLVSLEHDELWATRVRSNLVAAGLAETARVTPHLCSRTRTRATDCRGVPSTRCGPFPGGSTCSWSTVGRRSSLGLSSAAIQRC